MEELASAFQTTVSNGCFLSNEYNDPQCCLESHSISPLTKTVPFPLSICDILTLIGAELGPKGAGPRVTAGKWDAYSSGGWGNSRSNHVEMELWLSW